MEIRELTRVDADTIDAMRELVGQVSSSAPALTGEKLTEVVASDSCMIFVALVDGRIIGTLTLVVFPIPTGVRA